MSSISLIQSGSVVYNLQDRILSIERLRHLKVFL